MLRVHLQIWRRGVEFIKVNSWTQNHFALYSIILRSFWYKITSWKKCTANNIYQFMALGNWKQSSVDLISVIVNTIVAFFPELTSRSYITHLESPTQGHKARVEPSASFFRKMDTAVVPESDLLLITLFHFLIMHMILINNKLILIFLIYFFILRNSIIIFNTIYIWFLNLL